MNAFLATLVPALGHALVQFVWQGAAIGVLAAIALRVLRDASPQARYLVACLALLACVAAPVYSVAAQFATLPVPVQVPAFHAVQTINFAQSDAMPTARTRLDAWLPAIVAAWAAGASLFCLRTLFGAAWLRRMTRGAAPGMRHGSLHATWQARLDALAGRMQVRRVVLRLVDALESPVVAGWWRPVVLLPAAVALRMPADLVEALLAHELAHVRRHDYLVNLLQRVVEALLFYHPATWWISRRVRIEREHVADRLAADALGEPRRLAVALAALSELQVRPPVVPHLAHAAHGGLLMSRIQHLVHARRPAARVPAGRIALPLLGLAAACIAFYAQAQIGRDATPAAAAAPVVAATPAVHAASQDVHMRQIGDHDDGHSFALVRHGQDGYTMSGSTRDMAQIDSAKRTLQDDFLWFRRDGKAWVVDDPSIVGRAQAAWKDSEALGDRMEALGKQMEAHGKTMEAYGAQMEQLSSDHLPSPAMHDAETRMRALSEQQQALAGKQQLLAVKQRHASDAESDTLDRQMDALGAQMDTLGEQMQAQSEIMDRESETMEKNRAPMEALSRQMEEASKPMDALGQQMNAMGKQQEQLSKKAMAETERLIAESLQKGLAKPAPKSSAQ